MKLQTVDPEILILILILFNFDFLKKGLGLVPPLHFEHDFSRKCFQCYILLID